MFVYRFQCSKEGAAEQGRQASGAAVNDLLVGMLASGICAGTEVSVDTWLPRAPLIKQSDFVAAAMASTMQILRQSVLV